MGKLYCHEAVGKMRFEHTVVSNFLLEISKTGHRVVDQHTYDFLGWTSSDDV